MPSSKATDSETGKVVKVWLRYAPKRDGERKNTHKTKKEAKQCKSFQHLMNIEWKEKVTELACTVLIDSHLFVNESSVLMFRCENGAVFPREV